MKNNKTLSWFIGFLVITLVVGTIAFGSSLASGIANGLALCVNTLIPSLFPFMVLSNFLVLSGLYKYFSLPLLPFTRFLFKMPKNMGPVIALSFIGGFPVGAKNIQTLYEQHEIDENCANRLLSYCINPGPAFIITGVGAAMLGSMQTGIILFTAQILASVIVGVVVSLKEKNSVYIKAKNEQMGISEAFVKSVNDNVRTMLSICAFVVVFSSFIEVIKQIGIQSKLVQGILFSFLEVTTGCVNAATNFKGNLSILLICFALSFCGISVICQVKAILAGDVLSLKRFFISRLIHFPVMYFTTLFLFRLFPQTAPAFSNSATALVGVSSSSFGGFVFIILTCFSLIYTVNEKVALMKKE